MSEVLLPVDAVDADRGRFDVTPGGGVDCDRLLRLILRSTGKHGWVTSRDSTPDTCV